MSSDAVVAFVGVLCGSATTAAVTIYSERIASRRDREAQAAVRERERSLERAVFQRDSLLGLQQALAVLMRSVYHELDRSLGAFESSGTWPARQWATPTATGWADAETTVDMLGARVFDGDIRSLASELRTVSRHCVWARSATDAQAAMERLEELMEHFNSRAGDLLITLY